MEKLFGGVELLGKGTKSPASALSSKQVVGLYFSAHWCPPCRGFTPKLAEAYKTISADKSFEIVFISSDKDETQFASYFEEMPWLALPFAERDLKKKLSKQYKVNGIPALILLDGATGAVLNKDGRSVISKDPTGANFPWAPKTLDELLGDVVLNGEGDQLSRQETLTGKHVALYFSAHWCPPCKRFTPELAKTYAAIKTARSDFELVFVSGDRDEKAFKEYFREMPWLALPFDEERNEALSSHFEVEGIPTLVVLSPEGKVLTTKGRAAVSGDPDGKEFPWLPKPVTSIEDAADDLNETPALIVFAEKSSAEDKAAMTAALGVPAEAAFAAAAAGGGTPEMVFATAYSPGSISQQVRSLCKLDESDQAVAMVMLDIADDGAFYVWKGPEGDTKDAVQAITAASIDKFLADYKSNALERKQLS